MAAELHSLIEAVRSREERRRRAVIAINAALCLSFLVVPSILAYYYPAWFALMWLPPLVVAAHYISHSVYQSIHVSKDEASEILDGVLRTKGRVRAFAFISQSSAAPDLIRSEFIAGQIRERIPQHCTPENLLDLRLTTPQKWALSATVAALLIAVALLFFRPFSALERVAATLQRVVENHPELPERVKLAAQESIQNLAASDLEAAQESLRKTQAELTKVLSQKTSSRKDEHTIQQSEDISRPNQQSPSQPETRDEERRKKEEQKRTEKQQKPDTQKERQKDSSENSETENKERKDDPKQESDEAQQKKEKQPSEDSKEKSDQGASKEDSKNQEQEGQSNQEQDSKKDDQSKSGQSKSGQSNKSEDGDGEGSGQGEGTSGSGAGTQGENKEKGNNSQGSSGDAKDGQGQGEGSSQGSTGGAQSQPQSGSAKEGDQQQGSTPGSSGLEQLKDAVSQAEQEVQKEQQQQEKGTQEGKEGKDGEEGKGEGTKESESGKEAQGEKGNTPKDTQQGKGDAQEKSDKKGESQGKQGEGEKESTGKRSNDKNSEKEAKEQNESGNSGSAKKEEQQQNPQEKRDSTEAKSDGVGDRSSIPDRSAQAVNDAPPANGIGGDMPNLPLTGTESKVEGKDERLDSRFTGAETTLEENNLPAQAKTSLDDVLLAKPQGSTQKGRQPIPLEYKEIIE